MIVKKVSADKYTDIYKSYYFISCAKYTAVFCASYVLNLSLWMVWLIRIYFAARNVFILFGAI